MSRFVKNKKGQLCELPPYKCKVCGLSNIENEFDICVYCGFEADTTQVNEPDVMGGANHMSLNQYKQFWETNKNEILAAGDTLVKAVELARKYYKAHDCFGVKPKIHEPIKIPNEDIEQTAYEEEKSLRKKKLVRNEFATIGKYGMPIIKKQDIDIDAIDLIGYRKIKQNDAENQYKTVHFFTYDWLFNTVYEQPEKAMEKLDQYYALLTPEFSLYWDMPKALQIYNTFKNRWCGAYWQKMGKIVIPTVCCSGEDSYDFCFDGIEEGSVVAISTYRREKYKTEILKSYNKMLEVIKPSAVICYGEAFPEMQGNIKVIQPYDEEELIEKLGEEEYLQRKAADELYPTR